MYLVKYGELYWHKLGPQQNGYLQGTWVPRAEEATRFQENEAFVLVNRFFWDLQVNHTCETRPEAVFEE